MRTGRRVFKQRPPARRGALTIAVLFVGETEKYRAFASFGSSAIARLKAGLASSVTTPSAAAVIASPRSASLALSPLSASALLSRFNGVVEAAEPQLDRGN